MSKGAKMNYKSVVNFLIEVDYVNAIKKQSKIQLYSEIRINPMIDYILRHILK